MDDKSITDLLSQLIPDDPGKSSAEEEQPKDQDNILVEGLKTLVGQSEGDLEQAVNEFLKGKGVLHDITNSAVTRGKSTADSEIAEILTKTFKLSPTIARLIAPLLTNLLPFTKKEKETTSAKKPRRKTKPKTSSKEKEQTASKKKPSKKTASEAETSAKEKETASAKKPKKKTATKPKTSSSKPKKKTTTSAKPKKTK